MIDTTTGRLLLDGVTPVDVSLTRARFLASPLARDAEPFVGGEDWARFDVGVHEVSGDSCRISLQFRGERLAYIAFALVVPGAASAEDEYSLDVALAAKARHDAWLADKLGPPPYEYPWGVVESAYHPQDVSSTTVVRYR